MANIWQINSAGQWVIGDRWKIADAGQACCYRQAKRCDNNAAAPLWMSVTNAATIAAFKYSGVCYTFGSTIAACVPTGGTLLTPAQVQTFATCVECNGGGDSEVPCVCNESGVGSNPCPVPNGVIVSVNLSITESFPAFGSYPAFACNTAQVSFTKNLARQPDPNDFGFWIFGGNDDDNAKFDYLYRSTSVPIYYSCNASQTSPFPGEVTITQGCTNWLYLDSQRRTTCAARWSISLAVTGVSLVIVGAFKYGSCGGASGSLSIGWSGAQPPSNPYIIQNDNNGHGIYLTGGSGGSDSYSAIGSYAITAY